MAETRPNPPSPPLPPPPPPAAPKENTPGTEERLSEHLDSSAQPIIDPNTHYPSKFYFQKGLDSWFINYHLL